MLSFHIAPGFIGSPHLAICGHPGLRPSPSLATTAANPAFSCRCGSPGTGLSPRETPLGPLRSSAPCHNGSESRIFLPLRKPWSRPVLRETPIGPLRSSVPCHNGSESRIFLPLRMPWSRPVPARDPSRATSLLRPSPQRQRIPHFPAVADAYSSMKRSSDAWNMTKMYNDNDNDNN